MKFFSLKFPANLITCSRALCIILYGALIIAGIEVNIFIAAFLMLYGYVLGDLLDGWVARKTNTANRFGEILDIIADKIADVIFAFAVLMLVPQYAWVVFIFLVFKVAMETLIWRTVGNQNHLNPDNVKEYSKMYTWLANGWPLEAWVWSKALFFVPVLLGFPIPYYEFIFACIIICRSYLVYEMLKWHAQDVSRELND